MTSALNFAKMTYFCIRFRLLVAELGFRGQGTGVSPLNLYRLISIADYIMLKTKISVEDLTLALPLKKVCYNVSLCESCQRQSCKAFIGLTIHAKMIGGGGRPLLPEILDQTDRVGAKSPIFDFLSLVTAQP